MARAAAASTKAEEHPRASAEQPAGPATTTDAPAPARAHEIVREAVRSRAPSLLLDPDKRFDARFLPVLTEFTAGAPADSSAVDGTVLRRVTLRLVQRLVHDHDDATPVLAGTATFIDALLKVLGDGSQGDMERALDVLAALCHHSPARDRVLASREVGRIRALAKDAAADAVRARARLALAVCGEHRRTCSVRGQRGVRILSIDGGGTRGVVALEMLRRIEALAGSRIHEMFDLIVGTSTGAIIAALIGMSHKTLDECEALYMTMGRRIFTKSYLGNAKMLFTSAVYDGNVLAEVLRGATGGEVMIASAARETTNKVCLVSTLTSSHPSSVYLWRNYNYAAGHESRYPGTSLARTHLALRASCAAPTYFSAFQHGRDVHQDGGVLANNPAAIAVHEAQKLFPDSPIECVLSLGNGFFRDPKMIEQLKDPSDSVGWRAMFRTLVESATSVSAVHEVLSDLLPDGMYFRFQPELQSTLGIDEGCPEKLGQLQELARQYISQHEEDFVRLAGIIGPKAPRALHRYLPWLARL